MNYPSYHDSQADDTNVCLHPKQQRWSMDASRKDPYSIIRNFVAKGHGIFRNLFFKFEPADLLRVVRDLMLVKEADALPIDLQAILLQVYICLVPLEHVQAKQQVRPVALQDCQGAGQVL